MALIQPHAAVRCPALAERAHARGRRNVLVRHGSRSRRGGDGRGPGWWGSRARVRRVVWHAPRSPRVPSSAPPLVIALPEPVRRPCPSLPPPPRAVPRGSVRARACERAAFFPTSLFRVPRARARGQAKQKEPKSKGTGPTNQHHRKSRSININQSLHHSIQARIACPVRPAVGPPGSQAAVGRSEGRGRRAQCSAYQPHRAIDRSMAMDESIDSSSSASSVVVGREAVLPVCDPVLAAPTCMLGCSSRKPEEDPSVGQVAHRNLPGLRATWHNACGMVVHPR